MEPAAAGRITAWALLGLAAAANTAGHAFDRHARSWWFDRILHGGTILALTLWLAVIVFGRVLKEGPGQRALVILLLASPGIAVGALWRWPNGGSTGSLPGCHQGQARHDP